MMGWNVASWIPLASLPMKWAETVPLGSGSAYCHGYDVAIWTLAGLILVRALRRLFHFCIEIQSDVAELLLDIKTNLVLGCFSRTLP